MISHENASQLAQFRQQVYQNFTKRADALMNLVDALSSNTRARSVVELSLEACFERDERVCVPYGIAKFLYEAPSPSTVSLS